MHCSSRQVLLQLLMLLLLILPFLLAKADSGSDCNAIAPLPENTRILNFTATQGSEIKSHKEAFTGPNSTYNHNASCHWEIPSYENTNQSIILIKIGNLSLENNSACNYDNLTLKFTLYKTGTDQVITLCGRHKELYYLSQSSVTVAFITDYSVSSHGFVMQWTYLSEEQADVAFLSLLNSSDEYRYFTCPKVEKQSCAAPLKYLFGHKSSAFDIWQIKYPPPAEDYNKYLPDVAPCLTNVRSLTDVSFPHHITKKVLIVESLSINSTDPVCHERGVMLRFSDAHFRHQRLRVVKLSSIVGEPVMTRGITQLSLWRNCSVQLQITWMNIDNSDVNKIVNINHGICPKIENTTNMPAADVLKNFTGNRLRSSEHYPSSNATYKSGIQCEWDATLIDPIRNMILLRIASMDLEKYVPVSRTMHANANSTHTILSPLEDLSSTFSGPHSVQCKYDNLTLYYTDFLSGQNRMRVLCGKINNLLIASTSSIEIKFLTDSSVEKGGFDFSWYEIPRDIAQNIADIYVPTDCRGIDPKLNMSQTVNLIMFYELGSYQPNENCFWNFTIGKQEMVAVRVKQMDLDPRDSQSPVAIVEPKDTLTIQYRTYHGLVGKSVLFGNQTGADIAAYDGQLIIAFSSDQLFEGKGFQVELTLMPLNGSRDFAHCPKLQKVNDWESEISGSGIRFPPINNCTYNLLPKDESHMVKLIVQSKGVDLPVTIFSSRFRSASCKARTLLSSAAVCTTVCMLIRSTEQQNPKKKFSALRLKNETFAGCATSQISALMSSVGVNYTIISDYAWNSTAYSDVVLQMRVLQVPYANHNKMICKSVTVSSIHAKLNSSSQEQLVPVKALKIKADRHCVGNIAMEMSAHSFFFRELIQDAIKGSISCDDPGQFVMEVHGKVTIVNCSQPTFYLPSVMKGAVVNFEWMGPGDLVLDMQLLKRIKHNDQLCPKAPTKESPNWVAHLPLLQKARSRDTQPAVCYYRMQVPKQHDMHIQLQHNIEPQQFEQLCGVLNRMQLVRPQLMISVTNPEFGITSDYRICAENSSEIGALAKVPYVLAHSGDVVEINSLSPAVLGFMLVTLKSMGLKEVLVDNAISYAIVEQCPTRSGFANSKAFSYSDWKVTKVTADKVSATTEFTIAKGSSQRDCAFNLLLRAAYNVIMRRLKRRYTMRLGVIRVTVRVTELSATCGYNDLILSAVRSTKNSNYMKRYHLCSDYKGDGVVSKFEHKFDMPPPEGENRNEYIDLSFSYAPDGFKAAFDIDFISMPLLQHQKDVKKIKHVSLIGLKLLVFILIIANIAVIAIYHRNRITRFFRELRSSGFFRRGGSGSEITYQRNGDSVSLVDNSDE